MENNNAKTIAIISYITIIGWIIAFVMHSNEKNKSSLAAYHIRQSLGIGLLGVAIWIFSMFLIWIPYLGSLLNAVLWIGMLVLLILGIIAANNEEEKPVPLVGEMFQNIFSGIK